MKRFQIMGCPDSPSMGVAARDCGSIPYPGPSICDGSLDDDECDYYRDQIWQQAIQACENANALDARRDEYKIAEDNADELGNDDDILALQEDINALLDKEKDREAETDFIVEQLCPDGHIVIDDQGLPVCVEGPAPDDTGPTIPPVLPQLPPPQQPPPGDRPPPRQPPPKTDTPTSVVPLVVLGVGAFAAVGLIVALSMKKGGRRPAARRVY